MIEIISYAVIYIVEALIAWQYFSSVFLSKYNKKTTALVLTAYCEANRPGLRSKTAAFCF